MYRNAWSPCSRIKVESWYPQQRGPIAWACQKHHATAVEERDYGVIGKDRNAILVGSASHLEGFLIQISVGSKAHLDCGYVLDIRWVQKSNHSVKNSVSTATVPRLISPWKMTASPEGGAVFQYYQEILIPIIGSSHFVDSHLLRLLIPVMMTSEVLQQTMALLVSTHRQDNLNKRVILKSKALGCFAQAIDQIDSVSRLAIIYLLLLTESVENGEGPWRTHLEAVSVVLGDIFGKSRPLAIFQDDLQRALVLQFVWWDTIGSLLSQQRPILQKELLENALGANKAKAGLASRNTSFELFGCTEQTFSILHAIAHGSILSMDDVQAVPTPNDQLLIHQCSSSSTIADHTALDTMWRNATALYIFFSQSPYPAPRKVFESYASKVFDGAAQIPWDSPLQQKMLFPLIIAGACTPIDERRSFLTQYCARCYKVTGMGIFQLGLRILRQVWRMRESERRERNKPYGYSCWRNVTVTEGKITAMLG